MSAADRGIVVIGAGIGGVRTVEQLRAHGYAGPLTLVGAEPEPPYDRPPLSKQVLRGERDLVRLRDGEGFAALDVALVTGVTATAVDPTAHAVTLDDGSTLGYDALVVATGARPRTLPAAPAGVHVLRTAQDCRALRAGVQRASRAVVVGAGFIGCEVAASLRTLGLEVTVIEMASAPLVTVLGEQLSRDVVALHEAAGVDVRCGVGVAAVEGDATVEGVRLADGAFVPADLVVVGLGVVPATDWLLGSGIDLDDGVSCDERGRSSAPHVFAVGDVARWRDPRTGRSHRFEHWTSAVDQATVVARAVTGADDADAPLPVPYFWSDHYRVKIQSLGLPSGRADIVVLAPTETKRLALYGEEGVLTAVVGFASPSAVMKMRPALTDPTPFDAAVEQAQSLVSPR